jgi:hypothetical protein
MGAQVWVERPTGWHSGSHQAKQGARSSSAEISPRAHSAI